MMMRTSVIRQKGFTLLELLLVLVIIGITVGLIAPTITNFELNKFKAQVRQGVAVLSYARRTAIVESVPITVRFFALEPSDFTQSIQAQGKEAPYWKGDGITLLFQIDPRQLAQEVKQVNVTFFPEGGSTGGVLSFQMEEQTAAIQVEPITGRISSRFFDEEFTQE